MPVLRWTTVLILAAWNPAVLAVGLGSIQIQSGIGQPLRASVPLLNAEQGDLASACLKGPIDTLDGVFIEFPRIATSTGNAPALLLTSRQNLNEPTLKITVDFG